MREAEYKLEDKNYKYDGGERGKKKMDKGLFLKTKLRPE